LKLIILGPKPVVFLTYARQLGLLGLELASEACILLLQNFHH